MRLPMLGMTVLALTAGIWAVDLPAVSGDGRFVAYADEAGRLFVLDRANGGHEPVAEGVSGTPAIDATGRRIAYVADATIFVADRSSGARERVSPHGCSRATISADGTQVGFVCDEVRYLLDRERGETERSALFDDDPPIGPIECGDFNPPILAPPAINPRASGSIELASWSCDGVRGVDDVVAIERTEVLCADPTLAIGATMPAESAIARRLLYFPALHTYLFVWQVPQVAGPDPTCHELRATMADGSAVTAWFRIGCDGSDDGTNACGLCGPLPEEICDGLDNDCDGEIDEGLLNACGGCGTLPTEFCDGLDNDCDGEIDEGLLNACGGCGTLPTEFCDGLDNDCDGEIDEGVTNACGSCRSLFPEVCDGIDNDCNGEVDDGVTNACGRCGAVQQEICDGIDNDCDGEVDENVTNACGGCGSIQQEICDGIDNDCDGEVDENVTNACGRCGAAPAEVCDGLDNDCDGEIDEGLGPECGTCLAACEDPAA